MSSYILFWMDSHNDLHRSISMRPWPFSGARCPVHTICTVPFPLEGAIRLFSLQ